MLVQLDNCVVCGSDLQKEHSCDGCLSSLILFKYEGSIGTTVCSEVGLGTTGCSGECCFGIMYCEWYGVCDFVLCLSGFLRLYSVGVCVNVCGVVCVVVCCLFLTSGVVI